VHQVANYCEELETEFGFFEDIYCSLVGKIKGMIYGWPSRVTIIGLLPNRSNAFAVTWDELLATGRFKNPVALATFMKHYFSYEALDASQKFSRLRSMERQNPLFSANTRIDKMSKMIKNLYSAVSMDQENQTGVQAQLNDMKATTRRLERDNRELRACNQELQKTTNEILQVVKTLANRPQGNAVPASERTLSRNTAFLDRLANAPRESRTNRSPRVYESFSKDIEDEVNPWEDTRC